jgi:pimeloyl-ACP methyl ester carboxylesterase
MIAKILLTVAYTIGSLLHVNVSLLGNRLRARVYRLAAWAGWPPESSRVRYVDAGSHRLRMSTSHRGSPTVVFEAGGPPESGSPLEAWSRLQREVSRFASTVSYDRAGIGFSEKGPRPRDARHIAHELRSALRNAAAEPPYILVGASFGGLLARVFAGTFPNEVAGMVLLDPTQEEEFEPGSGTTLGLTPSEWEDFLSSLEQARDSRVPDKVPVVLITTSAHRVLPLLVNRKHRARLEAYAARSREWHAKWLRTVRRGRHIVLEDCGHHIALEAPGFVVDVVRQMVRDVERASLD